MTSIPISTLFIGLNGLIVVVLSSIVALARAKTRVWHGESRADVSAQPNYLETPNAWAALVERLTVKMLSIQDDNDALLQRTVRAHSNFTESVPHALLLIVALELMHSESWLLWLLGGALTIARIAHAWGLIQTYGPSPGRAIGYFLTVLVYLIGAGACVYQSIVHSF